ncbi:MAG: right-handed parallel beta-helix repeat-containing protein [Planctomycetaceae bacterium]|nr:right-handed parallel beta-helix repeat-containing protein [Planctomycetaceae bacterium]
MRTAAKVLALTLLLALRPACGGGGGGGGGSGTGASLPSLPLPVAPVPAAVSTGGLAPVATPGATTISVTGKGDDVVQNELQAALTAGGNVIVATGGGPRTIVLGVPLTIPSNRTVILDGLDQITLSGGLSTRILQLNDNVQLTLQRLRFVDARSDQNGAAVDMINFVRQVTVINCTFDNCQTREGGPDRGGGALRIWSGPHTQISGCTFNRCAASNGGAVNSLGTRLTILNSTFTQNAAFGTGGGAELGPTGRGGIGGAVYVDNVSNDPAAQHQLQIAGCVFNANVANDHAGAVFGYTDKSKPSTTVIDQCTFAGNVVVGGHGNAGALYSQDGTLTLTNSTFNLNTAAGEGGGIFRPSDSALTSTSNVTNCTFQGNSAGGHGGGLWIGASAVNLLNVTVAENVAGDFAGGIFLSGPTVTVQNCVFESNAATGNPPAGNQTNGTFSGTANIQAPNTAGGAGKAVTSGAGTTKVASALLGPLQDNGGATYTRLPQLGSPAINLATGAPATDQRGVSRVGAADSGSCEAP